MQTIAMLTEPGAGSGHTGTTNRAASAGRNSRATHARRCGPGGGASAAIEPIASSQARGQQVERRFGPRMAQHDAQREAGDQHRQGLPANHPRRGTSSSAAGSNR